MTRTRLALLCILATSASWGEPIPKDCALKQLASIDLIHADDLLVAVQLDGKAGFVVLSTGNAVNVIWSEVAKEWGLRTRMLPFGVSASFGNQRIDATAEVKSLVLDDVDVGKTDFGVTDRPTKSPWHEGKPIIGVLGTGTFDSVDFELDLSRGKLNLFSPDHCPGRVVYWTDEATSAPLLKGPMGNLYAAMELDGKKVQTIFASDTAETSLRTDVSKRLYGFDLDSPGLETESGATPSGNSPSVYRRMKLTAPGLEIENARGKTASPQRALRHRASREKIRRDRV